MVLAPAFAMADPVASVTYAIEEALRAFHGGLVLPLPTMALVVVVIVLVIVNYHELRHRNPQRRP